MFKKLSQIYIDTGQKLFSILLPYVRLVIRRTSRAYVIIYCDSEVLLVKNWFGRQKWHLPGGGIKRNEHPVDAVLREAKEELGIDLMSKQLKLISKGRWKTDSLDFAYLIFVVHLHKKPQVSKKSLEILSVEWINFDCLGDENIVNEVKQSLNVLIVKQNS